MLPNITDYHQAIIEAGSFATLTNGIKPVYRGNDLHFASGNFAVVYKMQNNGKFYALKCFLKEQVHRLERQKKVHKFINRNPSPYWIDYQVLENELWVINQDYAVVWMPWLEAPTLGNLVEKLVAKRDTKSLNALYENIKEMFRWLQATGISHCDLKHDNILVYEDTLKPLVIDYDGLFLPEFEGQKAEELGGKCYQHPKRGIKDFNKNIDQFSMLVILTSLKALAENPELWGKYHHDQNLLFDVKDFTDFTSSSFFQEIKQHSSLYEYVVKWEKVNFDTIKSIDVFGSIFSLNEKVLATRILDCDNYDDLLKLKEELKAHSTFKETSLYDDTIEGSKLRSDWYNRLDHAWKKLLYIGNLQTDSYLLERLTNLYKLNLGESFITDLSPLSKLTNLQELNLEERQITDLSPLSKLTNLTTLHLNNNQITNLSPLSKLTNLRTLNLTDNQITDLSPLSHLTNLEALYLINNQITDLSPLPNLKQYGWLTLSKNRITDLSPLSRQTCLTVLHLESNQITDLSPLSNLYNLTKLFLSGNKLSDLSPLSNMKQLERLFLSYNQISDLNPLSNLTILKELDLESNQIIYLTHLSKLTNLLKLQIKDNPISVLEKLLLKGKLKDCWMGLNTYNYNYNEIE